MRANVTFVVLIYLKLQIDTHNVFLCRSVAFLGSVGPSCQQFFFGSMPWIQSVTRHLLFLYQCLDHTCQQVFYMCKHVHTFVLIPLANIYHLS